MEKIVNTEKIMAKEQNNKGTPSELLILKNRTTISIEGVEQVLSSSENNLNLKLKDTNLLVLGREIQITKLDVVQKTLDAVGKFDSIKYGKTGHFFKRIFK